MSSELIAALSALGGAIVGGFINFLSTRSVKNHEWKLALIRENIAIRQKLYAEFLVESQRLVVQSIERKIDSLADFNILNGKFAEISLVGTEPVIHTARELFEHAITRHGAQEAKESKAFIELRQNFIDAAKKEIKSLASET